jgi:hypothetical protein
MRRGRRFFSRTKSVARPLGTNEMRKELTMSRVYSRAFTDLSL